MMGNNERTIVAIHQLGSNSILPDRVVVASFEDVLVKSLVSTLWEPDKRHKRRQKACCPRAFLPVISGSLLRTQRRLTTRISNNDDPVTWPIAAREIVWVYLSACIITRMSRLPY